MADERLRYLSEQTGLILLAAVDRDTDTVATALGDVGVTYGNDGVYALCCGLAETIRTLVFPQIAQGDGSLTGDMLAIQTLDGPPASSAEAASLWAARFVAAYVNGDAGNSTSLFFGALADWEQSLSNVAALVGMAGDVARHKEQERRQGGTTTEQ